MTYNEFDMVTVNGKEGTIIHVYNEENFEIEFTDDQKIETINIKDITI